MKKLLALFLTFSSATTLYTMERDDQSLNWFRNEGWRIVSVSGEKPSGECVKAVFLGLSQTDNCDQSTKKEYSHLLHMDLAYPSQIKKEDNSVKLQDINRCKFLSWQTPFLPKPLCYLTVQNEVNEIRILEIDTKTKPATFISDDFAAPTLKHNMDQSPIAFMRPKNQPQATSIIPQPKKEVPSAVAAKPYSATTKFVGGFLIILTLPLAALFAAYKMGYVSSDDISQLWTEYRQSFLLFGFPPA